MAIYKRGGSVVPIFTVTQGSAAVNFNIPGLAGDSGIIYRLDFNLVNAAAGYMNFLFNGNASTLTASRVDYSNGAFFTGTSAVGFAYVHGITPSICVGSIRLWGKTGGNRIAQAETVAHGTQPEAGVNRAVMEWTETVTALTNVTIVGAGGGNINAGSTVRVYADGSY